MNKIILHVESVFKAALRLLCRLNGHVFPLELGPVYTKKNKNGVIQSYRTYHCPRCGATNGQGFLVDGKTGKVLEYDEDGERIYDHIHSSIPPRISPVPPVPPRPLPPHNKAR